VELAAVIGDERSWWASEQGVEQYAEGEREQPLCDPLDQAAGGLGEVLLEPHLAFEVGDRRLDDQAHAGEAALVLEEAHAEARKITRDAVAERERLGAETHRIKALLGAALDAVEDADGEARAEAA